MHSGSSWLGGGDDVGDRNNVAAPDLARKDRRLVVMDTLDELAADGAARKFGLDAPLLAAVAHDIVVVHVYVADSPE